MINLNRKTLLNIAFIVVVLLGGLWLYGYISNPESAPGITSSSSGATGDLAFSYQTEQEFSEFLEKITRIKLNFELLEKINQDLTDFSPGLPEIPRSRPNPFAPVGSDVRQAIPTGQGIEGLDGDSATSTIPNFLQLLQEQADRQQVESATSTTSNNQATTTSTGTPATTTATTTGGTAQ